MRLVASFLLCSVTLVAGAAEVWRWKDASGAIHYSDQPRPGAERIVVNAPAPSGDGEQPAAALPDVPSPEPPARPLSYSSCAVNSPANDETFNGVQPVSIILAVEPALQTGHRIQVFVNGTARTDWPANSTEYTFAEVFRGSHTLSVRIVDASGRVVCSGPSSTFHLRQNGLLSPGRQGQQPAPGRPNLPPPPPAPRTQPGG